MAEIIEGQNRIYITGCAHTGTTLLKRLFWAFEDIEVIPPEISSRDYVNYRSLAGTLVGKRTRSTVCAGALSGEIERQQLEHHLAHDTRFIVTLRSGSDTIESGWTKPHRWIACIEAYVRYAHLISLVVFYQDLVERPDTVQQVVAARFGLKPCCKWSSYPDFVPEHNDGQSERYSLKSIAQGGVNKDYDWRVLVPDEQMARFEMAEKTFDGLYSIHGLMRQDRPGA